MKSKASICFLAAACAASIGSAAPLFTWESGTEGWSADSPNSVATSTTGATEGVKSLAVTQPMSGMWWNVGTTVNLSPGQRQALFTNATELRLDVFYPNPGYTSWWANPEVEVIIQGENVGWTGLATRTVAVDGSPQTLSFPLTPSQASAMASGNWGQIVLRFGYGNGGSTSTEAVFYVDNFTTTASPVSNFFWKGDVDEQWTSLNWTTSMDGSVPGGALPTDGSAGIAFAASGAANLSNVIGANQHVKSVVVTAGTGLVVIGGAQSLTIGEGGIWLDGAASGLTIATGGIILGANQIWCNKSPALLDVTSAVGGSGSLTKSGAGPLLLRGANTYTGSTRVLEGVLRLQTPTLNDRSSVEIAAGATLDLLYSATDQVAGLKIGAQSMAAGIYGAQGSGAQFERAEITGSGFLVVVPDPYLQWISQFAALSGSDAGKGADPDHDGATNIEEFALDGNPEEGKATGKMRTRIEQVGGDRALVVTLPVRNGASFTGAAPATATVASDGIAYEIGGSNDLVTFDQSVYEIIPALSGEPEMPTLHSGWTYRTFRLDGWLDGPLSRGAKGFLRVKATAAP
ncbi:autotransporter-associated beta strand repeat-containing protein [Luteolibacter sp. LG18]|uniref:autotransporter-associated beta strand repeat-containing protein n=1 Tax=Luteolibacter sp. LG18 TaxID=2819286 RepID=UPI002B2BC43A|nr:hypothetical protein llg_42680 [Luteolibacter sp. LG18]